MLSMDAIKRDGGQSTKQKIIDRAVEWRTMAEAVVNREEKMVLLEAALGQAEVALSEDTGNDSYIMIRDSIKNMITLEKSNIAAEKIVEREKIRNGAIVEKEGYTEESGDWVAKAYQATSEKKP